MTRSGTALPALRSQIAWILVPAAAAVLVTLTALASTIQIAIVLLGVTVALALHRRDAVVVFAVVLIPTLSLVRRVAAGRSGYTDADPLILLPLILVVGVILISWTHKRVTARTRVTSLLAVATIVGALCTIALTGSFAMNELFFVGLLVIPLLLALALGSGQLGDVWGSVRRALPPLAAAVGTYGIIQFFALPSWDAAWMRTSKLTSIGQAEPLLVRVFGASESPGPYALFVGTVITLCLAAAVTEQNASRRFGWVLLGSYLAFPLLLSGVRSSLIGVAVCAGILTLVRARGATRVLLIAFLVGAYFLLTVVIDRFGAGSTILTADRYTSFSTDDRSFVARLDLFASVGDPIQHLVGNPGAPAADNLYIDTLLRYGLLSAVALLAFVISIAILALRQLREHRNEAAALCAVFIVSQTIFGPTFNALFGILIGVVFGTVMAHASLRTESSRPAPANRDPAPQHTSKMRRTSRR